LLLDGTATQLAELFRLAKIGLRPSGFALCMISLPAPIVGFGMLGVQLDRFSEIDDRVAVILLS
jgi:hypothetical protein